MPFSTVYDIILYWPTIPGECDQRSHTVFVSVTRIFTFSNLLRNRFRPVLFPLRRRGGQYVPKKHLYRVGTDCYWRLRRARLTAKDRRPPRDVFEYRCVRSVHNMSRTLDESRSIYYHYVYIIRVGAAISSYSQNSDRFLPPIPAAAVL